MTSEFIEQLKTMKETWHDIYRRGNAHMARPSLQITASSANVVPMAPQQPGWTNRQPGALSHLPPNSMNHWQNQRPNRWQKEGYWRPQAAYLGNVEDQHETSTTG